MRVIVKGAVATVRGVPVYEAMLAAEREYQHARIALEKATKARRDAREAVEAAGFWLPCGHRRAGNEQAVGKGKKTQCRICRRQTARESLRRAKLKKMKVKP